MTGREEDVKATSHPMEIVSVQDLVLIRTRYAIHTAEESPRLYVPFLEAPKRYQGKNSRRKPHRGLRSK